LSDGDASPIHPSWRSLDPAFQSPLKIYRAPRGLPAPTESFDVPSWTHPKVAPDRHAQIAKALRVPGELVGKRPETFHMSDG
jgi:hypothetical protein